ncbi:flavodoxin [Sulfurimonas sp.]|jgi:flavodoxin I|uniref:flavodoxin n=1 Tax=Sulfurimonas sp. TaxID=2022749 RepID=UPI0025DF8EAF|nr:flavodoxin [Sulfurimonas sp.]MCK9472882.1 flavodoxin [Sulfurimonas sp.]MDD3505767.1 flavodoxin [Sulfurimonas sp.]
MSKIGLFYASSTGNTESVAKKIKEMMRGVQIDLIDVSHCSADAMNQYDFIIIGASTWGGGDLQDDWDSYFVNLEKTDFSTKTVALFGLGDQEEYNDNYLDAMGTIYEQIVKNGAKVVGSWPTDGYEHDESTAIRDGEFVGLALDEDNQEELTDGRLTKWIAQISPYFIK